ncbi:MAG TPA: SufD family Fe-S cluster assembly protein [Firmicutes bacterium]|nr:SufD family Fe-S cluster assembly protein [Bacillota bacterium]
MNDRLRELEQKALSAVEKRAAYGPDIDLNRYRNVGEHEKIEALESLSRQAREAAYMAGIEQNLERTAGTYMQLDSSVVFEQVQRAYGGQLELLSTDEALAKYDGLPEYWWQAVPVDQDKYTARVALNQTHGYFIRVLPGQKVERPVQACLLVAENFISQNVHNVIVVEEGAEVQVITGCTSITGVKEGLHIGVSEFYVKRGARLTFHMIHNWAENFHVRPRTGVIVEEGGVFVNNYVLVKPVGSLQTSPSVYLRGKASRAEINTIAYGMKRSVIDIGSRIVLEAQDTAGESISRAVADDGSILYLRGMLVGKTDKRAKAHLDCRGILKSPLARIVAIPELDADSSPECDLAHEAAVGPIDQEAILYLMARGLTEDEAVATITRGFMNIELPGLPEALRRQIDQVMEATLHRGL